MGPRASAKVVAPQPTAGSPPRGLPTTSTRARRPCIVHITGVDLRRTVALLHRQDGPRSAAARAFFDLVAVPLPAPA